MRGPLKGCSVSARRDDEAAGRCRSPPIAEVTNHPVSARLAFRFVPRHFIRRYASRVESCREMRKRVIRA